jgi:hypothetical protein
MDPPHPGSGATRVWAYFTRRDCDAMSNARELRRHLAGEAQPRRTSG